MIRKPVSWIAADNCYIFQCPHCDTRIQVDANQVNCRIFRHGLMKNTYVVRFSNGDIDHKLPLNQLQNQTGFGIGVGNMVKAKQYITDVEYKDAVILRINEGQQIPSHSSKKVCDELVAKRLIWGCGKPFLLVRGGNGLVEHVETCAYI